MLCGDSSSKFCALFAPVPTADSTQTAEQVAALQAGWSARGVAFADSRTRLISVVLHDRFSETENTLFIGHVGVLLPALDGTLCFVEKVAFQEPYRLVKLRDRTALSDYLMEKYDTAWGTGHNAPLHHGKRQSDAGVSTQSDRSCFLNLRKNTDRRSLSCGKRSAVILLIWIVFCRCSTEENRGFPAYSDSALQIKVTICARVQFASGLNLVSLVPLVTSSLTAHRTASA